MSRNQLIYVLNARNNSTKGSATAAAAVGKSWDRDHRESNSESVQQQKSRSKTVRIFQRFAEKCSMQGPPYISTSTWWFPRLAWTLLLMTAIAVMTYHLFFLCRTYFAWPTKNKLSLGFASLQFPAVTVCNVNPIKASRLKDLSDDLQKFVQQVNPGTIGGIIDKLPKKQSTNSTESRRRREASDDDDEHSQLDDVDYEHSKANFSNAREDVDEDETYKDLKGYSNSWEREGKQSAFSRLETRFHELYAAEERGRRMRAGHHVKEMLLSCSFAGKSCYPQNFTLTTSTEFGNCFTLQYNKFVSRASGPNGGLELLFYLDVEEYIRGITADDGLQVSVHSPNSVPFPRDDGVAVSAGYHTKLSLTLIHIERQGQPYGDCSESSEYLEKYQISYSRQLCFRLCQQGEIHKSCNCRDETADDVNIVLNHTVHYKPCRNKKEVACMLRALWRYQSGAVTCNCYNPCTESKYEKSMSSRPWPNQEYAKHILVKTACRRITAEKCQLLKTKDAHQLSREFVKLNIFYEDLNYENITEEPDYETVQFISDVGGTLGLWIGLSVLSLIEVFQLFVELFRHLCCCHWTAATRRTQ
ncbi:hypothetical protein ACOMHN_004034 [Nucella lapillus]